MLYSSIIDTPQEKRKFEQIYEEYRQTMYFTAYRILHDSYEAEDAVQNAFLRIIDNLEKIDLTNRHKTKGFVVIVVENATIDLYRKKKRENAVSYDELSTWSACAETSDLDSKMHVHSVLQRLPIQYKTVLLLKYSHGYNNPEISEILRISEENVRQRIVRAKKKLSQMLEQEGES